MRPKDCIICTDRTLVDILHGDFSIVIGVKGCIYFTDEWITWYCLDGSWNTHICENFIETIELEGGTKIICHL